MMLVFCCDVIMIEQPRPVYGYGFNSLNKIIFDMWDGDDTIQSKETQQTLSL